MPNASKIEKSSSVFSRKQGNILGVGITGTSREELLKYINEFLKKKQINSLTLASYKPLFVTTPNPEQVILSENDLKFKKILQNSDISLCDGVGLLTAHEYIFRISKKRSSKIFTVDKLLIFIRSYFYILKNRCSSDGIKVTKGRDFMMDLIKLANSKRYKVFLLGSTKRVLNIALNRLSREYSAVQFKAYRGSKLDSNSVPLTDKDIRHDKKSLRLINRFQPKILFVAYGAPKQEKWVYRNIDQLKTGLVMVVGSSFDYIAGTRKPVPVVIDKIGLEWFWRLLTGSQNIKRIYKAVVKFPFEVIKNA